MPIFDLPLEQLRKYKGTNPRPKDMDEYWDSALRELEGFDFNVKLERAQFEAPDCDCFDLWFTGIGGARVYSKYLRPKDSVSKPHPAVIVFHGYRGSSPDWADMLKYVFLGFSVAALDCRGQGGRSEDLGGVKGTTVMGHIVRGLDDPDPKKLLYRSIFLDTVAIARIMMDMEDVDETRVGVTGGSQGGGLALACSALEPRVKLSFVRFPFLSDYKRVWDLDLAKDAYEELSAYFRRMDPRHEREREVFTRLGYIDVQHLASRIKAEVLMVTGLMDTVCPPSTQFAAYNKIKSKKKMIIYPDYGHENMPGVSDIEFEFLSKL